MNDFVDFLLHDTLPNNPVLEIPGNAKKYLEKNSGYLQNSYYAEFNKSYFEKH